MFGIKDSPKALSILSAIALVTTAIGIYYFLQIPPTAKPEKSPYSYTESELAMLIRSTGERCKQPAVVTPTTGTNSANYLVACHSNTGTYEITITNGSQPQIKKI